MKIEVSLLLVCGCGRSQHFVGGKCYWDAHRDAMDAGWRFDAPVRTCWCSKCVPKKVPHLEGKKDVGPRSSPRVLRRIQRREDQKKVLRKR